MAESICICVQRCSKFFQLLFSCHLVLGIKAVMPQHAQEAITLTSNQNRQAWRKKNGSHWCSAHRIVHYLWPVNCMCNVPNLQSQGSQSAVTIESLDSRLLTCLHPQKYSWFLASLVTCKPHMHSLPMPAPEPGSQCRSDLVQS